MIKKMAKKVKCRWCGEGREVMDNQKTFMCEKCKKVQTIGKLTIVDNPQIQNHTPKSDDKPTSSEVANNDVKAKKEAVEVVKSTETPLDNQTLEKPAEVEEVSEATAKEGDDTQIETRTTPSSENSIDLGLDEVEEEKVEEVVNKCGSCGAVVGDSMICECGEDYN